MGASILRNNPHLNHIIEYDKRGRNKGIGGFWQIGKKLKMESYNMVITPHRYLRSSFLTFMTGAPVRKGYDVASGSFLFTEKIHYDKSLHEVEKLLCFVGDDRDKKRYEIELYPGKLEKERVDEILKNRQKNLVVIAVGSKWFTKRWPLEYFNQVISALEEKDVTVAVVGGVEEKFLNVVKTKNMLDLRGETTLLELAELISRAKIVVTNDSSPIHIASAFKDTKILAIFGPTVRELGFFPWSKNSIVFENKDVGCRPCSIHGGDSCPKKHFKCMLDITPDLILEEIYRTLESEKDV